MMNARNLALTALLIAALIYGVTYTIAKDVMNVGVGPFGFILIRIIGSVIVFWILGSFIKDAKKIEKQDLRKIAVAAFFGIALNMLSFFKGLSMTTPISASVIMVTSPIMVLIFSSLIIKERIPNFRILGVFIGLIGAVLLIIYGQETANGASNAMMGNLLVFVNASSYALYLVLVKGIISKYNPIVFIKWLYLFGLIYALPFGFNELVSVPWETITPNIHLKILFVVIFTSCVTYLFNLYALSKLKPTTVSVFIYLQPVIASLYALSVGSDSLNMTKIGATLLIFAGVFLVTRQPRSAVK